MIEIEIDGKKIEVAPGSMIIEAADASGIYIPRFCYHKKLSVAANCRMCLVEVEKVPKPLPACATPVTAGMKIYTKSPKAIDGQRSVMEFLLINHPLDCPICDQGGACELQDLSMGFGQDDSRYENNKRSVKDENLGSLIATDMTRCIQCTRCVRFQQEIAGVRELGTIGRGDRMGIESFLKSQTLKSEISGNIIDLCPVGALTSRLFRFKARAWELTQTPATAIHDCVGSSVYIHTLRKKVMRVVPRENEAINETWISDRDRFAYEALYSPERLTAPLIKEEDHWQETDWSTALNAVAKKLKDNTDENFSQQLAGIISPNVSLEELYLFQKLMRGINCYHIDHRLRQTDVRDQAAMPLYPTLPMPIEDIQAQDLIILLGSHVNHEQPMIAHRIRKAQLQGAKVLSLNPYDYEFAFDLSDKKICLPAQMLEILEQIADGQLWENYFKAAEKKVIFVGALAFHHPEAAAIRYLLQTISEKYGVHIAYLTEGANTQGAWLAGCVPHRKPMGESVTPAGFSALEALDQKLKTYVLYDIEPAKDFANANKAMAALTEAETVIAFSAFRTPSLLACADVILPIATYVERAGTFINCEGRWQKNVAVVPPMGESRPGWKILRVLGNLLQLPGFDYMNHLEVMEECQALYEKHASKAFPKFSPIKYTTEASSDLQRITEWPIYHGDGFLRRAASLQDSACCETAALRISAKTAKAFHLKDGQEVKIKQDGGEAVLPVCIDARVPENGAVIYAAYEETVSLGSHFGSIEISTDDI